MRSTAVQSYGRLYLITKMADRSKRKKGMSMKTVVINGKRNYIFDEITQKYRSKVRVCHRDTHSRIAGNFRSFTTASLCTTSTDVDGNSSNDHIANTKPAAEGHQSVELLSELSAELYTSSMSQNIEVSTEVAYATELSRLDMVTVVSNCTFVFPDFNSESRQLKVHGYIITTQTILISR